MIKIANVELSGNLVLSPMAGITDAPMRQMASRCGADYAVSEMISSDSTLWNTKKTQLRLSNHNKDAPWIIQIAGASADVVATAAIRCEELGADIIEINMGCPAKKVCNVLAGSALLKDELLVKNILSVAVNAVSIPITLKTRLGWNNENENIITISKLAQDSGIKSLTIHGRTREDMYNGNARYDLIAEVKQNLDIPIFANGDISTPELAKYVLDYTKADGLYIGRGALGKPWLFNQIKDYLAYSSYDKSPSLLYIEDIIYSHLLLIYEHYGDIMGARMARKHMKWYLQNLFDDKLYYYDMLSKFSISESKNEQLEMVVNFFELLKLR